MIYFVALAMFALWLYRRRLVWLLASLSVAVTAVVLVVTVKENHPRHEAFITRSSTETTIYVRDEDRFCVFTTDYRNVEGVMSDASRRYSTYLVRRGIDGIDEIKDGERGEHVARHGNVVAACGRCIVFVSDDSHARDYGVRPDYAVVCRGFRGNIIELASRIGADSILLSRDLNLRRHDRYASELRAEEIPFRSLRDEVFHIEL